MYLLGEVFLCLNFPYNDLPLQENCINYFVLSWELKTKVILSYLVVNRMSISIYIKIVENTRV